ncbi:MAG: GYD domain-containing protein [Vicinamibacterales bacterium]|nr:GYD domain-containing protein [Vicinamibacterales bacterium]
MPKYLLQVSYTTEGSKGLMKDGGSKRRAAAKAFVESLGGKMESFYYAFGATDAVVIADLPDNTAAAAASLTLASSGAVTSKVTVLLTAEDLDQAVKKGGSYTPPGR